MTIFEKLAKVKAYAEELKLKAEFYNPIVLVIVSLEVDETQEKELQLSPEND